MSIPLFKINTTWNSICDDGYETRQIFAGIMIAVVVIGLLGNVLVFSTILILREYKKSVTNWYILQLTLADTLFLLMLPFTAHSEIVGKWEFPLSLCKFKEALLFINYYASIYFLVIMSFDRYLAVTKAFASKKWITSLRSPIASYIFSICGWVLSVLLCIQLYNYSGISTICQKCGYNFPGDETSSPYAFDDDESYVVPRSMEEGVDSNYTENNEYFEEFLLNYFHEHNNRTEKPFQCMHPPSRVLTIWIYGNFFGAFCLPFLLICFFYGMIIWTITAASKVGNSDRQRSYRRRVTMIVLALVALFGVSWFPWYVEKLAKLYGIPLSRQGCENLTYAVRIIAYLNSALNPYFYSFLGTHFRDRLMRASNSVGFFTRSRGSKTGASGGGANKKRKYSTSNSGGSRRSSNKQGNGNAQLNRENYHEAVFSEVKSVAQGTERTVI